MAVAVLLRYNDSVKKSAFFLTGLLALLLGLELAIRHRAAADPGAWTTRPLPTPATQATRIVVLGDSIAYGTGLPESDAWPARLSQRLKDEYPQRRWQVINAGVSGNTAVDAYARFDVHVRAYRPHRVIIALGLNDCRQVYRAIDPRRLALFRRDETTWWGKSYLLRAVVNRLRPLPEPDYAGVRQVEGPRIPPDDFRAILSWLVQETREIDAQPVLLTLPPLSPQLPADRRIEFSRHSQYNSIIRATARETGAPFIEVSHRFSSGQPWLEDGVHLSAAGETEIAERVLAAFPPQLTIDN